MIFGLHYLLFSGVHCDDVDGNTGGSRLRRFKTPAEEDTTPPVIVRGPAVLYVSDRAIAIGWKTDEPTDGYVWYKGGQDSIFVSQDGARMRRGHFSQTRCLS